MECWSAGIEKIAEVEDKGSSSEGSYTGAGFLFFPIPPIDSRCICLLAFKLEEGGGSGGDDIAEVLDKEW